MKKPMPRLLEHIADWCDRFTPLVTLDPPDGLLLDITGAAHLFGGEAADAGHCDAERSRAQGFAVQGAIAGTSLAARALARYATGTIALPGGDAEMIAPLPITALDCGDKTSARPATRAGLKTIAQVAERQHERTGGAAGQEFRHPAACDAGGGRTALARRAGLCPT